MISNITHKIKEILTSTFLIFKKKKFILSIGESRSHGVGIDQKTEIIQLNVREELGAQDCKAILIRFKRTSHLVINFNFCHLDFYSKEEVDDYIKRLSTLVNTAKLLLKNSFKIHLQLNHLEKLLGCTEYFKEEKSELYRISIKTKSLDAKQISTAYQGFIDTIQNNLLTRLQNTTQIKSAQSLYLLPEQLNYFKGRLISFIQDLGSIESNKNNKKLKGIYFNKNTQLENLHPNNRACNFLPGILSSTNKSVIEEHEGSAIAINPSLFIKKRFFPDNIKQYFPRFILLIASIFLILMPYSFYNEYQSDRQLASNAKIYFNEISKYKTIANLNINKIIQLIDKMSTQDQSIKLLPVSYFIESKIQKSLLKKPELLKILQERISTIPLPERLYRLFKISGNNIILGKQLGSAYKSIFIDRQYTQEFMGAFTKEYNPENISLLLNYLKKENNFLDLDEDVDALWDSDAKTQFKALYQAHLQDYWNNRLGLIHLKAFHNLEQASITLNLLTQKNSILSKLITFITQIAPNNSGLPQHELQKFDYSQLSHLIDENKKILDLLKYSKEPGKLAFELSQDYLNGNPDSALTKLVNFSKSAPFPLKQWIYELAQNNWSLICQRLLQNINEEWESEILSFYKEFIQNRYPISESADEISLNDFQQFFGPDQLLDQFFKKHFEAFIHKNMNSLEEKSKEGFSLMLNQEQMEFWNKLNFIQVHYFDNSTQLPSLKLNIKILSLSRNSRSLKLNQAPFHLIYSHGPQYLFQLTWPPKDELENASLQLQDFSNHLDEIFFPGTWGLFRLFDQAIINEGANIPGLELHYEFPKQSASLLISNIHDPDIIQLKALKELNFPDQFNLEKENYYE